MFRKNGKMVAAASSLQDGGHPSWTTYVCTPDAQESAKKVAEAGGQVMVQPFDVFNSGRMAIFQDAGGAFFAVWEPKEHQGAELANEPGSFCWTELTTRDVDKAKAFYPRVFGWGIKDNPGYTEFTVNDRSIAGMLKMGDNFPPEVPPHWVVYFAVEDADATAAKAQELGGRASPIMDSPAGRFSIVNDPHGAVFAVIKVSIPS
jgi:hypothetical protein